MQSQFKSSFIPQSSVAVPQTSKGSSQLLNVLATGLLILTMLTCGGLYFYQRSIQSNIGNLSSQLSSAKQSIDTNEFKEIMEFSRRLSAIKTILAQHVSITKLFKMLESQTVSSVRFVDLNFAFSAGGAIDLNLQGEAKNYQSIALQESVFANTTGIISPTFNSFRQDGQTGNVSFSFKSQLGSGLFTYKVAEDTEASDELAGQLPSLSDENLEADIEESLGDLPPLENI